ncbi:GNAT family protein [Nocardioides aestuarii]|uniref:GNAT family protein n=1 Tax=Nocardioides aestuarii TaxID=252231 RepID=A0ABW4TNK3_9ACTN
MDDDRLVGDVPLLGLEVWCRDTRLRGVRERDLPTLADLQSDDVELDPTVERFPWHDDDAHRRRLVHRAHWHHLGTWSPSSWTLLLAVEHAGDLVGVQALEGEEFALTRTVDSWSWLTASARGRGIGVAMRQAVLGLAFDHLDALAAVSSARPTNHASLGVSRRLGYRDNGTSLSAAGGEPLELTHLRLTRDDWQASGLGRDVAVAGVEPCLPWFGLPA